MSQRIIATYQDTDEADAAIDRLVNVGYPTEDISVMTTSEAHMPDGKSTAMHETGTHELDLTSGATNGSLVGGTLGVIIAGAFAATATTAGDVVSTAAGIASLAGPLAAAIVGGSAGAAAGAIAGGAFGFLRGEGATQDSEDEAIHGDIVVAVDTDGTHMAAIRSLLNTKTMVTQDF